MNSFASPPFGNLRTQALVLLGVLASLGFALAIASILASARFSLATAPAPVAQDTSRPAPPEAIATVAVCSSCGVVEAVRWELAKDHGAGRASIALGVLGALGGAYSGEPARDGLSSRPTIYEVRVRMDDGSVRTLHQTSPPVRGVGGSVRFIDGVLAARG